MKRFTTSAQKTLGLSTVIILEKLEDKMAKDTGLVFKITRSPNIKEAKLPDGSKLIIAGFDKENGKTLAMIDHKNLPGNMKRNKVQQKLKEKLSEIFS